MNNIRKSVALLLAALLLLAMLPATGLAASYKVEALKLNQWYALHESSSTMPVYKLKVTGETIVAFNWKSVKKNGYSAYIEVYRDKACKDDITYCDITNVGSGSDAFVLYSGTYYIKMYDKNMNEINCSERNNKCVTAGKQPKGTYYVRVYSTDYSYLTQNGEYLAFYWK